MSNKTRAKFHCNQVVTFASGTEDQIEAKLTAQYCRNDDENAEDNQFSSMTPSGDLKITVSNPALLDFFKPGVEYYLDISPCPADRQSDPARFDKAFAEST